MDEGQGALDIVWWLIGGALLSTALAGGYRWIFHMPGSSYRGTPPPLDAQGEALRGRLQRHVRALAEGIGERHVWRPEALRAAAAYIEQAFRDAGLAPRRLPVPCGDRVLHNLEVRLPGSGATDEILVVGAHYDTVRGTCGADDNASGVAVLLELARGLQGDELEREIRLVAFVNEEAPHFGSDAMGSLTYAREARARGEAIVGMLSLEMLGHYTDAPGSQAYPPLLGLVYPDRGNFVACVGNLRSRRLVRQVTGTFRRHAEMPSEGLAAPELLRDIVRSDHWAFWEMGYPAMMLTDTADFRNPRYHGPGDTWDTLDYAGMARLTPALAATLAQLARG
ncbi:M20/M25/M40 family metallo-hydrolase [Halomonas koreensis]|uniref:M20/M25/M40 family metallo-hydrolase n=1 Tax=Halomonas koreensis TaxID=245385 RepID=A0ABU1FZT6_9GAMM|nr:M20/M25/M40 family metallo-hydrolase [Halomonas koreensis]MDR5866201.1 M20/M25/M40 family metallo-hydrolase [Halomonas koreensis]